MKISHSHVALLSLLLNILNCASIHAFTLHFQHKFCKSELVKCAFPPASTALFYGSGSESDEAELAKKKSEAAEAFISYNDGKWTGRAVVFDVSKALGDEASRRSSLGHAFYELDSETEINAKGITQLSTLQWKGTTSFSRYTTRLSGNCGFDVDAVDGSYSADHSVLDLQLPDTVDCGADSCGNVLGSFAIESSIAVSDERRIRSVLLYNFDKSLSRCILFDETKSKPASTSSSTATMQEDIMKAIGGMGSDGNTERMKKVQEAASKGALKAKEEAKMISSDQDSRVKVDTFQPNLRRLCSGLWEGDGVLRNHEAGAKRGGFGGGGKKGFGKVDKSEEEAQPGAGMNDGFAEWFVNVFKMNLSYQWDGKNKLRQECSLGVGVSSNVGNDNNLIVGWGELIEDGVRVDVGKGDRFEDKESLVVSTFDQGQTINIMLGSVAVKGSLSLKGEKEKEQDKREKNGESSNDNDVEYVDSVSPFISELSVFQARTIGPEVKDGLEVGEEKVEYFLSRLSRLYDNSGKLKSGSSAFFTLKSWFD
ncbi:hypothetical protein TrST_g7091 [Triparma strigata]|uniref:Uncharacterized protein n=1 Tax=Triparma strigata TaxID=1606541 RepID=A0A9W7AL70_9STRA|nr:hypothetical protein TrST_g7091 [Triparma strigata]